MSCKVLKLKGCEIEGSTFPGRTLKFINRDISTDTFSLKVKVYDRLFANIPGTVSGNYVYFSFADLEGLESGEYTIEYWGTLNDVGIEMLALENFTISKNPCSDCDDDTSHDFTLEFPEQTIEYEISISIIQVGGNMTDLQVKEAYERNADTNAFTDADKSKLDTAMVKDFREIYGTLYQSGGTENPQFSPVGPLEIPFTSFLRTGTGEYTLALAEEVDLNKVFFQNSVSFFESGHPAFEYGEMFLVWAKSESTTTELKFVSFPAGFNANFPNMRGDGANNASFYLRILN